MSDIQFIQAQGDLLDVAIAEATNQPERPAPRRRRWLGRPRQRGAVMLLGLVLAGSAAAAATNLLGSSQRLYLGHVNCYYGTGTHITGTARSDGLDTSATLVGGETPSAWCAHIFKGLSTKELHQFGIQPVADTRLVDCQMNASTVAVFISSGTADQCKRLGLRPLPRTFDAAATSVTTLARHLRRLYLSRDCWEPTALAHASRAALIQSGFNGWRVVLPKISTAPNQSPIGQGDCGAFFAPNPYSGNPYQSFSEGNRTLSLTLTIPRSIHGKIARIDNRMAAQTQHRCYGRAGVRALVDRAFAPTGMSPEFAVTKNPNGHGGSSFASPAVNRRFQHGCLFLFLSWPSLNDRTAYVWLIAHRGATVPAGQYPALNDFHR